MFTKCLFTCLLLGSATSQLSAAPTIDGRLDDTFWATRSRAWVADHPKLPDNSVRFNLGFDHEYLYFAADVTDPNVVGTHTGTKDEVWEDDAVEIFIDFDSDTVSAGSYGSIHGGADS